MGEYNFNIEKIEMVKEKRTKNFKIGNHCNFPINKKKKDGFAPTRINFLILFIFLAVGVIFIKLYVLQVKAYDYYKNLSNNQHSVFKDLVPERGEIFLRDGNGYFPVAMNKETKMAYAVPKEIEDMDSTINGISEILQLEKEILREKFKNREDMYEVLKHRLSEEEIGRLTKEKIKGIRLAEESYRYYPARELAAHALGYVGWREDNFGGRYGAELFFEDKLKGEFGSMFHHRDTLGRWISIGEKEIIQAKKGNDIILSIDSAVQYETEKILEAAVSKYGADRGTIIVMESQTGRILAMASNPSFDPNDYAKVENMEAFRNLAVSDTYEPGSIFKPFTMAAALDSGKINPQTTYYDSGMVKEAGYTIKNSDLKANGKQTMTEVLEKSLNTGVIFAEKLLGNRNFSDYIKRFGFGQRTNIDLPGEAVGNINNLKNLKSDIQFFTASFGQGITVTPIQLVSAFNAIANNGVLLKPQIVDKIIHSDGREENIESQEVRRVISPMASQATSNMLLSVVRNGHGKRAGVPGYKVGGKTGTAQVAKSDSRGYEDGKNIGSFVGFAPIDNPKFTVLVRLDNPKNVEWAESSAAPAFGELMKFLLDYAHIEPTEQYSQKELDDFYKNHTLKEYLIQKEKEDKELENKTEDKKDKKDKE